MAKMTSFRWAEKDDPMFTGRFHIHSVRDKDSGQKNTNKDKINYGEKSKKRKKFRV